MKKSKFKIKANIVYTDFGKSHILYDTLSFPLHRASWTNNNDFCHNNNLAFFHFPQMKEIFMDGLIRKIKISLTVHSKVYYLSSFVNAELIRDADYGDGL